MADGLDPYCKGCRSEASRRNQLRRRPAWQADRDATDELRARALVRAFYG